VLLAKSISLSAEKLLSAQTTYTFFPEVANWGCSENPLLLLRLISFPKLVPATDDYWHSIPVHIVTKRLGTDIKRGLSTQEVRARRQKYGHNVTPNVE
jgi:hypothetical protein